jgi:uncharacterized membrane protein YcaP (DUF421 family)
VVKFLYNHSRIDRFIEGSPTVLIDNGVIRHDHLRKELITEAEVELAARRQGFGSLDEIDRAVLDPGGSINCSPKKPIQSDVRYEDIMRELRRISAQLAANP